MPEDRIARRQLGEQVWMAKRKNHAVRGGKPRVCEREHGVSARELACSQAAAVRMHARARACERSDPVSSTFLTAYSAPSSL
eukprot:5869535-Pleurochrysis_carterae.AAC.2